MVISGLDVSYRTETIARVMLKERWGVFWEAGPPPWQNLSFSNWYSVLTELNGNLKTNWKTQTFKHTHKHTVKLTAQNMNKYKW